MDPCSGHGSHRFGYVITCTDPDPSINKQKSKKIFDLYFCILEEKTYFMLAFGQPLTKKQDPDPDPKVSGTEPWIRIRTKISGIHNTGLKGWVEELISSPI